MGYYECKQRLPPRMLRILWAAEEPRLGVLHQAYRLYVNGDFREAEEQMRKCLSLKSKAAAWAMSKPVELSDAMKTIEELNRHIEELQGGQGDEVSNLKH